MSHDAASSSSAPPTVIPVASSSSLLIHPYHCDASFHPGRNLCVVLTHSPLHAKPIPAVQMQISEFRNARSSTVSDDRVLSDLWTSHNQHGEDFCQHGIAITDISCTRDEDVDDAARNTRPHTEIPQTVALPTTFVYTLLPLGLFPVAVSVSARPSPLPMTTAPPAAPPAPLAPSAPAQAPPAAPSASPRASAPGPLALLRHLLPHLVPMQSHSARWPRSQNRINVQQDLVNAHLGISSTHRYKKLNASAAVAFASSEIANWVVDSWNHAARYQYAGIYTCWPLSHRGPDSGKFTSSQGIHKTVIDYAACSRNLFSSIKTFSVADGMGYDHAALIVNLEIDIGSSNITFGSPRKKRKVDVVLPDDTELDKLFVQTLAAGKDEEKKLRTLYGPVLTVMYNAIKSNNSRRLPERGKDFCLGRVCNILAPRCTPTYVWKGLGKPNRPAS
ncbi:hypothetical protein B0H13DRAFT_2377717 [Mycena leptocephala]|nr:hypothetical protein B0H13DRAFT_2377717 [Mycena leptocephala]